MASLRADSAGQVRAEWMKSAFLLLECDFVLASELCLEIKPCSRSR